MKLRGRAIDMGYTLNEYAMTTLKSGRRVAGRTEEEIYAKLKLDFIAPELRENCGEIEAAADHRLPKLVERERHQGRLADAYDGERWPAHHRGNGGSGARTWPPIHRDYRPL